MDSLTIYKKAFADALKVGRDMTGLTVEEISERIGVSPGTYRNLESGQRIPTVTQIEGFAELFGTTFNELLALVRKTFINQVEKNMNLEGKDYIDYVEPIFIMEDELISKWKEEKKEIASKGTKLAEELILAGQRYHTPNKYLTEKDIFELSEQIMALVDLRVKQVLRKHKK